MKSGNAISVTLIYLFTGVVWIVLSDRLIDALFDPEKADVIQTYKGTLFVVLTSLILFVSLGRQYRKMDSYINRLEASKQRLRDHERQLLSAQKIAKLGYWRLDLKSHQLYWSDEVYRIWGFSKEDYKPDYASLLKSVHPQDRHLFPDAAMLNTPQPVENEFLHRVLLQDGTVKWIQQKATTIAGEDGEPLFYEGIAQDVTERLGYIESLKEIARMQSHEVRGPLARILGIVRIFEMDKANVPAEMSELISDLGKVAGELDEVIHRINEHTANRPS